LVSVKVTVASLAILAMLSYAACKDGKDGGSETPDPPGVGNITEDFLRAAADRNAEAYGSFWAPEDRQTAVYYEDALSRTPDDLTGCDVDNSESVVTDGGNGGLYVDVTFPKACGDSGVVTACNVWLRRSEAQWWVAQFSCTKATTDIHRPAAALAN
jgi:hypothetical protein